MTDMDKVWIATVAFEVNNEQQPRHPKIQSRLNR